MTEPISPTAEQSRSVDTLAAERDALEFAADKSLRYHQRRRATYEWRHKAVMFGVLISGSSAFAQVFGRPEYFGLAAAVLGAIDLVFSFSHKARDHEMLHRRFSDFASDIKVVTSPSPEDIKRWNRTRLEIEADEPPIYWALEASCYNETTIAWGREEHGLAEIKWYHRSLMNIFRFDKDNFPTCKPQEMAAQPQVSKHANAT